MTRTGGQCDHCGRTSTPCWRKGPPEKPCLCNACGVRWLVKHSLEGYMPAVKPNAPAAAANTAAPSPQQQQSTPKRGTAVSERSLRKRKERSSTPDEAAGKVLFAGRTLSQRSDADAALAAECAELESSQQLHPVKGRRAQRQRQLILSQHQGKLPGQQAAKRARAMGVEKYEADAAEAGPYDLTTDADGYLPVAFDGHHGQSEGTFHPFNFPFFPSGLNPYVGGLLPQDLQHLYSGEGLSALLHPSAAPGSLQGGSAAGLGAFGPSLGPPLLDTLDHLGPETTTTTHSGTSGDATDGGARARRMERMGVGAAVHSKAGSALAASLGMAGFRYGSVDVGFGLQQGAELVGPGGPTGALLPLPRAAGAGLHAGKVNPRLMVDLADAAASLAALHRTSSHLFATPVTAPRRPRKQARPVACC